MKAISVCLCMLAAMTAVADVPPPIPATPAAVDDIVYVRPFTVDESFKFFWCAERPTVQSGTLLVLKVNKDLVIPRQVAEPVLYVGNRSAERINRGDESGYVIAIVPGDVNLAEAPIWFGTPDLPERVDAATVKAERAKADKAGIRPFSAEKIKAAQANGGARLNAPDMSAMLRDEISLLIERYSPQEQALADSFRVPVVRLKTAPSAER